MPGAEASRALSEADEEDSSLDEDADEDDDDDLLTAAVAAAEAENLEAKRGRRKFSLLQKGSSKHSKSKGKARTEQAQPEQQQHVREGTPVREFTPQQKVRVCRTALESSYSAQAEGQCSPGS